MALITFDIVYNTETGQFTTGVETTGYSLKHSGSSYLRILKDGKEPYPQVGTIGPHRPFGSEDVDDWDHLTISISQEAVR